MQRICKGDEVVVIAGKDKGRRGVVLSRASDEAVTVEGVNLSKKHVKPNPMKGVEGGIVDKAMPIHQSNVALWNPATGRGDKVGVRVLADGKKVRVFKSNGELVPAR